MPVDPSDFSHITREIIGAAIEVHRTLGPGLLESTYLQCLKWELGARKQRFVAQRQIPLVYKGTALDTCYRIDLIVEDRVVVEVKAVIAMLPVYEAQTLVYEAQTLTYMRLTECPLGLVINFNVPKLIDGVHRLINPKGR
jgi:GxxExxY protein